MSEQFDKMNGRFRGSIEDIDPEIFKFDSMVFALVCMRVDDKGRVIKDDGTIVKTMGLAASDMVPLTGPLRDQAIAYMAHGADQGILDLGQTIHHPRPAPEGQAELPVADYAAPPPGVDANGEVVKPVESPDDEFDVPVADEPPVTARATDVAPPEAKALSEDPKAAATVPVGTRVGRIHGDRKDKDLEDFLSAP